MEVSLLQRHKNIIIELFEEARDQQVIKELPLPVMFALTFGPLTRIFHSRSLREGGDCVRSRCYRRRADEGVLKHIEVVSRDNALRLRDIRTRRRRSVKYPG